MSAFSEFAAAAEADARAALVSILEGGDTAAKLLVRADGSTTGGLGDPRLDAAALAAADELLWAERSERCEVGGVTLFVDVTAPAPRLVIFGAVDYSAALARLARAAGWRPSFATRARLRHHGRFPDARRWSLPGCRGLRAHRRHDSAHYIAVSPTIRSSTTRRSGSRCARRRPT